MPTSSLDAHAHAHAHAPDDDGMAEVLVHVVLNTFGVIGSASVTLLERWDQLPGARREQLLALIHDSVRDGIDRLQFLYHALSANVPGESALVASAGG